MALMPNITFGDTYVGQTGLRPRFAITDLKLGQTTTLTFWLTIGESDDATFTSDETGLEGTAYPSARAGHNTANWKITYNYNDDGTKQTIDHQVPRCPVDIDNITKLLDPNTEYRIRGWCYVVYADEGDPTLNYGETLVSTTSASAITMTSLSAHYNNSGPIDYAFILNTSNQNVTIEHEHSASNTVGADPYPLSGGIIESPVYRANVRVPAADIFTHTRSPVTSAMGAVTYYRWRVKELVNNEYVFFPSNTGTESVANEWINPEGVVATAAYDVTTTTCYFYIVATQYLTGDATLTAQIATNQAMNQNLVDHTSAGVLVSNSQGGAEDTDFVGGSGYHQKVCALSSLSNATTYYFRAKFLTDLGTVAYGELKSFTTVTERYAVKTPSPYGVGYFFLGRFSAFKKLREIDKPEFSPAWKSAVVINSVAYLGNVKYRHSDGSTRKKPDRILKSLPNEVDTFSRHNYIDVAVEDGDSITALSYLGDRLIEFKQNSMYVINVGGEYEYLEGSYKGVGAEGPSAVCRLPYGVAFVNASGCYIYTGKGITNLLQRENKQIFNKKVWSDFISPNSMLAYIQEKNMLMVTDSAGATSNGHCYLFDIDAGGWIYYKNGLPKGYKTNFIYDDAGRALFAAGLQGKYYYPQIQSGGNAYFEWQSKEIDFDDPSTLKKIYEITVSYTNTGMDLQPLLYYSFDSGKTWETPDYGGFRNHKDNSGWYNAIFKPRSDEAVYTYPTCRSIMLKIKTYGVSDGYTKFKLNEVGIEHRVLHKRITADITPTSTISTGNTDDYYVTGLDQSSGSNPSAD